MRYFFNRVLCALGIHLYDVSEWNSGNRIACNRRLYSWAWCGKFKKYRQWYVYSV